MDAENNRVLLAGSLALDGFISCLVVNNSCSHLFSLQTTRRCVNDFWLNAEFLFVGSVRKHVYDNGDNKSTQTIIWSDEYNMYLSSKIVLNPCPSLEYK